MHPYHDLSVSSGSFEAAYKDHNHPEEKSAQHECPEYILAKSLQNALAVYLSYSFTVDITKQLISPTQVSPFRGILGAAYEARAPPILLI